ncbi:hypothetical protein G7Z17_g5477 [Cylindrodendrum hubeiense]|uniref:Uncharacterized protein n=1 Tax=Cylindrodendrum hubeiense TaxID=595255 RepID=A0A9P5L916_9HYPO|nr:hypothetical protein G7Z17_g5477 [Cylindrodendrum hubeiense]
MAAVHRDVKLTDLANELILSILEFCPDLVSLINATHAHPTIYHLFRAYRNHLATQALKNELPEEVYTHAKVAFLAGQLTLKCPDNLSLDDIGDGVRKITECRDRGSFFNLGIPSALSVSRLHRKVVDLADVCLRECAETREQNFAPLRDSLTTRLPSSTERIRIHQAIYLFEILRSLCWEMHVERDRPRDYYVGYFMKLRELHLTLTESALAPWEMYQVIGIQAFFRRALHGFGGLQPHFFFQVCGLLIRFAGRDEYHSERVMPGFLSYGISFLHKAICKTKSSERDDFLHRHEPGVLEYPIHALGAVLSRGARHTWTRKPLKPLDEYKPFWTGDTAGIRMWTRIEAKQLTLSTDDPQWVAMFDYELMRLEGRLDVWSAALWDDDRWEDIEPTLRHPEPECWDGIQHHCDPVDMGFHIARSLEMAWMRNESIEG